MSPKLSLHEMVNIVQYPLPVEDDASGLNSDSTVDHEQASRFVADCRNTYRRTGLCALPDFILPEALDVMAREANEVSADAYFCSSTHNAWLTDRDEDLPEDHIAQWQEHTTVGSVPFDRIGDDSHLNVLYQWDPLKNFIAQVLGKPTLHRFADPFGACSINVFTDGGEHGWHFDESEFTVTLMLQAPENGGTFEYCPMIRGLRDEFEIVSAVLNGDHSRVVQLPFTAGTLLIFGGRQTLHRVTRVGGKKSRLVPVLCYSEQANQMNSERVRELFWGRTGVSAT